MKDPEVVEAFERVLRYELVASYGTPERAFRREETSDGWCYWCAGTESAYEKFLAGWSAAVIEQQDADKEDAERYRWLRDKRTREELQIVLCDEGVELDAAIDAARKEQA